MKRISFLILAAMFCCGRLFAGFAPSKEFYQIKIYHLKNPEQEKRVDTFLQNAYLPALHRAGIAKAGVFKPVPGGEAVAEKLIYVFIPFSAQKELFKLDQKLSADKQYTAAGSDYLDAVYSNLPYERIEIIVLEAFDKSPVFTMPVLTGPKKDRIYELRSYEGHTEKISENKIVMFNKGDEVGLFKRLGFNAVFYAKVMAGSHMPNLMYLTTFENKASRDAHWDAFGKDDYWKKLVAMPEYQHNVSKNDTKFLYPTDYSDI
ncbi:NIPSNAP family protein [Dyadobacter frigoris]|uniref:NIPSNAP family containing protein n=1 Tax=Dyadobacter frigoris TaxID=2576211 RepID=A0A4U6DBT1_9BACT|nr:NIPSNAP family protein [Dyadobacter frigoris]TKT94245.1 NIPSNAP family containing protein [Dyadobacter frigoris]